MPSGRSQFTSSPTRLILVAGGLGTLWLILAGLLVMQLDEEIGLHEPITLTSVPAAMSSDEATAAPSTPGAPEIQESEHATSEARGRLARARAILDDRFSRRIPAAAPEGEPSGNRPSTPLAAEPPPAVSFGHLPVSHVDEPIAVELQALFDAILTRLTGHSAEFDPAVLQQASALVSRMNSEGHTFTATFQDPILDLARRRSVHGHALLVDLGLRPELLETSARQGRRGVGVHRLN